MNKSVKKYGNPLGEDDEENDDEEDNSEASSEEGNDEDDDDDDDEEGEEKANDDDDEDEGEEEDIRAYARVHYPSSSFPDTGGEEWKDEMKHGIGREYKEEGKNE